MKREDVEAISVGHAGFDVPAKPKRAKKTPAAKRAGSKEVPPGQADWSNQRAPRDADGRVRPRRVFRPEYKLAVLEEYERCSEPGQKGALLRREGLYSSIIIDWRRQRKEGSLMANSGRSSESRNRGGHSKAEVERMRRRIRDLEDQIAKQNTIIEVQGKVQELLEQLSKSEDNDQL